ncbi:hypothetical protein GCM10009846_16730 [Agrococcus versicolor]|uniref:Uncharacterized protein n=2 Tax=Agrococcus versicolor TaxID=501482 RepID=A0ABP5MGF9_9MICO
MPDFAMPEEDAPRRAVPLRPRGPRLRRGVGVAVVVAVVSALAIVGVPALVDQQRGRDAVATVERLADAVADGDVDAVLAAMPTIDERGDVAAMDVVVPASGLRVEGVSLVRVDGDEAIVRVAHAVGPDRGSAEVRLEDRDGWRVVEGLLALTDVDDVVARVLGGDVQPGPTWLLPGRYDLGTVGLGAVDLVPAAFAIVPPPLGATLPAPTFDAVPSVQTASAALDRIEAVLAACALAPADGCPPVGATPSDVPPFMGWSIDLAARSGTLDVEVTSSVAAQAAGSAELVTTPMRFAVTLADDLGAVAFEQTPASGQLP